MRLLLLLVAACSSSLSGCWSSSEEAQRTAAFQQQQQEEAKFMDEIARKYDSILFPPKDLKDNVFTYELQRFLKENVDHPVLLRGYLEDVEETEHGIIAEFSSALTGDVLLSSSAIVLFRLKANPAQAEILLSGDRKDPFLRELRFLEEPDYLVVARIQSFSKARRYEFNGYSQGENNIEIEVHTPPGFVSTGELMDLIRFPPRDSQTVQ